jgi:hypothetical protein
MGSGSKGRTHESMWDSILYVALVVAGRMLVANASDYAAPPKGRWQLVQLPRWGYIALGITIAVLAAISLLTSL